MLIRIEMPGEELKEALRPVLTLVGKGEENRLYEEALCVRVRDQVIEFFTTENVHLVLVTLPIAERAAVPVEVVFTGAAAQPLIKAVTALKRGAAPVSLVFKYGDSHDGYNADDATLQLKTDVTETTIKNKPEGRAPKVERVLDCFRPAEQSEFYVDIERFKNVMGAFGKRVVHVSLGEGMMKIVPRIAENDAHPVKTVALLCFCDK